MVFVLMNDLEKLEDIYDKIEPPQLFMGDVDNFIINCTEHLFSFCEENPKIFCKSDYNDIIEDELDSYIEILLENIEIYDYEEEIDDLKTQVFRQLYSIIPKRSKRYNPIIFEMTDKYISHIKTKLDIIREKDKLQPEQRTPEWFEQRHNLLSASTIWKSIDKQNYKNSLIYEKCTPIDPSKYGRVGINTPFHWGQKYEPVSQEYYEHVYDAKIEEFGCIPHTKYKFLGASPDGINVKETSKRYGRMLEIKNIVNREITGKPKKEYWVQTQLQMECCDLDECDFLECRFKEYENEEEFYKDGTFQYTNENKYKGIIIQFYYNDRPYYEYAPFHCTKEEFEQWYKETMCKNEEKTWVNNLYWYLEEVSCVLIQRNRIWFNALVHEMEELWNIILEERVTGYEHRKTTRKIIKKEENTTVKTNTVLDILSNQFKKSNEDEVKKYENKNKKEINKKIIVIDI